MYNFKESLKLYEKSPIAVYGIGTETERLLPEIEESFEVVGLLDGFRESGEIYGKNIISLDSAVEKGVKLIIAVARPGSCRAIAKRIGEFCKENDVALFDVYGKNLLEKKKEGFNTAEMYSIKKAALIALTEKYEAISTDLFDTLVMRQVLFSSDILEMVNIKLRKMNIYIDDFCKKRMQSEKELARLCEPTLTEIYKNMLKALSIGISAAELAEIEYSVDYDMIIPRYEMVEIISNLFDSGKKIYIVSDTYYEKEKILRILKKCGIEKYTDILISCEYGTRKNQEMFSYLKNIIGAEKCIHIGDDLFADIEGAKKNGLDSFRIFSAYDIFESVGYMGLYENTEQPSARVKIGLFISRLFNSPFNDNLIINSSYDVGFLFAAPIISDFMMWFENKIKEKNIKNIWFGARDGYLIKKLYDILVPNNSSVYFLTSRIAAVRAGVKCKKDIEYIADMKFSGTLCEQLKERFGIEAEDDANGKNLTDYSEAILNCATENRMNYIKYIGSLKNDNSDIAFFDFVAKGTTHKYLSNLVDNHIVGLYFSQLEKEAMEEHKLDICEFCDNEILKSAIFENYYILETILTSEEAMVIGFDNCGKPCYAEETRNEDDIDCVRRIQDAIVDYFNIYYKFAAEFFDITDYDADKKILELIYKFSIDCDFKNLIVEDCFFNRQTNISDLI